MSKLFVKLCLPAYQRVYIINNKSLTNINKAARTKKNTYNKILKFYKYKCTINFYALMMKFLLFDNEQ